MTTPVRLFRRRDVLIAAAAAVIAGPVRPARAAGAAEVKFVECPADLWLWSRRARTYLRKWYPELAHRLRPGSKGPLKPLRVIMVEGDKFIAFTDDHSVFVSAPYVRAHPRDLGMLAHEAVHAVQAYPKHTEKWLSEGIADYFRYYVVEPGSPRAAFDARTDSYTRGYQPAAAFLNWLVKTRDRKLVFTLDRMLAGGRYSPAVWRKMFGSSIDDLWREYKSTLD